MAITLGTMAVIFGTAPLVDGQPRPEGAAVIALIAANLFVVAFGMSWGPVVWVLLGEMFPNRIRAAALGLAAAAQWVANWVITVSFPKLSEFSLARVRLLCALRGAVVRVRVEVGRGNQGHAPGGHAQRGRAPRGESRVPVNPRDLGMTGVKQSPPVKTFDDLFAELSEKARTRPAGSGTVAALDGGVHGLGKKILEEAGEVWLAAEHEGDDALADEISQLLYWTQVLMISRGLTLDDVYAKL